MNEIALMLMLITGGLALLYVGANGLVSGSASLALRMRISPLVVGLTIVSFGTSAPELLVSLSANLKNQGGVAVGNVIGSNIFNIALILGLCSVIRPIQIESRLIRQDIPVLFGATALFYFALNDRMFTRTEGAVLFGAILAYTIITVRLALQHQHDDVAAREFEQELKPHTTPLWRDIAWIVGGLVLLVFGSDLLVEGATRLALRLGISEVVVALTVVAGGTGLPELATSLVAALKKESDIAVGNIVGSNIFNTLCIPGLTALIMPLSAPGIHPVNLWFMVLATLILLPLMLSGKQISRFEGSLLVGMYAGFLVIQIQMA